jgi:hypothetical protein
LTIATLVAGIAQVSALKGNVGQTGFKDGVIDYPGEGSGTSDSNLVRLSRGESVITANATDKSARLLHKIQTGELNDSHLKLFSGATSFGAYNANNETHNLLRAMNDSINNLQLQVQTQQLNITREGLYYNVTTEQRNNERINKLR